MIERIAICLVIAALAVGAFHLFDAKLKRDQRARERKGREVSEPESEPAQVS